MDDNNNKNQKKWTTAWHIIYKWIRIVLYCQTKNATNGKNEEPVDVWKEYYEYLICERVVGCGRPPDDYTSLYMHMYIWAYIAYLNKDVSYFSRFTVILCAISLVRPREIITRYINFRQNLHGASVRSDCTGEIMPFHRINMTKYALPSHICALNATKSIQTRKIYIKHQIVTYLVYWMPCARCHHDAPDTVSARWANAGPNVFWWRRHWPWPLHRDTNAPIDKLMPMPVLRTRLHWSTLECQPV